MSAVKEFGRVMTTPLGAPAGSLETFIEVPFDFEERRVFPDGLIRARRGSKTWTALVEVKTGTNPIARDQLECYLDVAREQGFDAVVTISNEIASIPGAHPGRRRADRRLPRHPAARMAHRPGGRGAGSKRRGRGSARHEQRARPGGRVPLVDGKR